MSMSSMKEDDVEYGMVMPFIDRSDSYVCGFEVGKAWGLCEAERWPDHLLTHTTNVQQLALVAKHFRCDMFVDASIDAEWCYATFLPRPELRLQLVGDGG